MYQYFPKHILSLKYFLSLNLNNYEKICIKNNSIETMKDRQNIYNISNMMENSSYMCNVPEK